MHRLTLPTALRRHPAEQIPFAGIGLDELEWSWPPYAPVDAPDTQRFSTEEWAPSTVVWHPQVRVGRWTVVYRRAA